MAHMGTAIFAAIIFTLSLGASVKADTSEDAAAALKRCDYVTAFRLYRPLADQGSAVAQAYIGGMYFAGAGVDQDYEEAEKWTRLAVGQGNADAQFQLGMMYERGTGAERDEAEAVRWYRLAAGKETPLPNTG